MNTTTRLSAVNQILSAVGESPVNSIDGTLSADVAVALATLEESRRETLAEGWHFNEEKEFELPLNTAGQIPVPPDALSVDTEAAQPGQGVARSLRGVERRTSQLRPLNCTVRDGRLYDLDRHTDQFEAPVRVTIIRDFPFEQLNHLMQVYVTARAARKFADRTLSSPSTHAWLAQDEQQARVMVDRQEADAHDVFMRQNPQQYQPYRRTS